MESSIGSFLRRSYQRGNLLIKSVTKLLCHIIVKPKTRDNGCLCPKSAVLVDSCTGSRKAHYMLTAPETARGNAINDKLPTFSQVNEISFL